MRRSIAALRNPLALPEHTFGLDPALVERQAGERESGKVRTTCALRPPSPSALTYGAPTSTRRVPRTDSASRLIRAPARAVFAALLDPDALTTWLPEAGGTRLEIRAEDVPAGISADDHAAGLESSLAHLATYLQR